MTRVTTPLRSAIGSLWRANAPLTAVGLLMTATAALAVLGLLVDSRVITGAPAWLKPLKFAVSTAIYCLTLAWVFSYLPAWPRTRRDVGFVTAAIIVMEVAIIDVQAWRGTASHFNVSTPANALLFGVMGLGILTQTVASVFVAVALWRQPFADAVMGWALRLGMTITIVGALVGGLMTRPTPAQLAEARATHRLTVSGAHTVGAADGGAGLPGTGWSTEHGDIRVPHFLGLHALQALAVVGLIVRRRRLDADHGVRVVKAAAASYVALFGLLLWQALGGQSLVQPDSTMVFLLGAWALVAGFVVWSGRSGKLRSGRSAAALKG